MDPSQAREAAQFSRSERNKSPYISPQSTMVKQLRPIEPLIGLPVLVIATPRPRAEAS